MKPEDETPIDEAEDERDEPDTYREWAGMEWTGGSWQ